jgi:hypothetical protein
MAVCRQSMASGMPRRSWFACIRLVRVLDRLHLRHVFAGHLDPVRSVVRIDGAVHGRMRR